MQLNEFCSYITPGQMKMHRVLLIISTQFMMTDTIVTDSLFYKQTQPQEWSPQIKTLHTFSRFRYISECLTCDRCVSVTTDIKSSSNSVTCNLLGQINGDIPTQSLDSTRWKIWTKM